MANSTSSENAHQVVCITVEAVIAVCAVLGNALVIGVVKRNRCLRNVTFCCIVSLALADMSVGLVVIPISIVVKLGVRTHFFSCLFMCCNLIVFTTASILSLLAIAVDRYLRIKMPTRYKMMTTPRNIWLCLGSCWIVSLIVGFLPMFGWNKQASMQANSSFANIECQFPTVMSMDYMVFFNFFGWVLLPLLLISGLYLEIFYILRKHLKQGITKSRNGGIFYGREYKIAKSLAVVVFLFAFCWLPISFINCLTYFWPGKWHGQVYTAAIDCSILLSHAHSAMNPVVYAFKIEKFRETYRDIVCKCALLRSSESVTFSDEISLE
ncbi:adenosine receptor A3-like [Ambystoma mexicanum]|uniref:adenosine receptor A3-like n=1 Tax=Ambystoma mexicanum TaxID=8296 RepID=UPI0037E7C416